MTTSPETLTPKDAAAALLARREARGRYLAFIEYVWQKPWAFAVGRHTQEIADAIDDAIDAYLAGVSSFLEIAVPIRHGKSDLVSRYLEPYFLARAHARHPDVMVTGYGADLVQGFSKDEKRIIESRAYRELFPAIRIADGENRVDEWGIRDSTGRVFASGLGGTITGRGYHLGVCDDYCKSRAEARSETYRQKTWDSFTNDFLTRRADPSITILCATPWNIDDIRGRAKAAQHANPDFPQFVSYKYPARRRLDGRYEYLFEARYSVDWYRGQYATLKKWATGLLDCEPVAEGGNRFNVDAIKRHATAKKFPAGVYVRAWDLASSAKERDKDDPDFTVGALGCVTHELETVKDETGAKVVVELPHLWLRDFVYCQAEAPERDALILQTVEADGPGVRQYVEAFGAYKDTYTKLKRLLTGRAIVHKSNLPGDKSAKLADLEPIFDAGNVHVIEGEYMSLFESHFRTFPDGKHDDFCDAAAIVYHEHGRAGAGIAVMS